MATPNEYATELFQQVGSDTSKNVCAALAFSLAMRLSEDDKQRAGELLRNEWRVLHETGIVPQKPGR